MQQSVENAGDVQTVTTQTLTGTRSLAEHANHTMSVFSYEPFYDFDRLLTEVFTPRTNGDDAQRRIEGDAPRALKPR